MRTSVVRGEQRSRLDVGDAADAPVHLYTVQPSASARLG
jgi:hypothetical protein